MLYHLFIKISQVDTIGDIGDAFTKLRPVHYDSMYRYYVSGPIVMYLALKPIIVKE